MKNLIHIIAMSAAGAAVALEAAVAWVSHQDSTHTERAQRVEAQLVLTDALDTICS